MQMMKKVMAASRFFRWEASALICSLSILVLGSVGCCTPEQLANSRLSQLLETNGYTLYTPFRSSDKPGTLFVMAKNHLGNYTEFTVSPCDGTFDIPGKIIFDPQGEKVVWADDLKETFSFSGSVGVDLLKVGGTLGLSGKDVQTITMSFGPDAKKYVVPFSALTKNKDNLRDDVRKSLADLKEKGQLNQVYLVLEALEVSSVTIKVELTKEFVASADFKKLKAVADAKGEMKIDSTGSLTISSKDSTLIGYKARAFPDTILKTLVSPPILTEEVLPAKELTRMKRK